MSVRGMKRIVTNALNGYSDKPKVEYWDNEVVLKGGHWAAREDVERALERRDYADGVQNSPTGKKIYIKWNKR